MSPDWEELSVQFSRLCRPAAPGQLLSLTLPLPRWPALAPFPGSDWCAWQRPSHSLRLFGLGKACFLTSGGTGRFAALDTALRGLQQHWHYRGSLPPLALTGFAFAPQGGAPFPNASLWVPELLLREQAGQIWLTLSCPAHLLQAAPPRWAQLWGEARQAAQAVLPAPTFSVCPNPLADQAFLARGRAALRAIAREGIGKLVLSRPLSVKTSSPLPLQPLLDALARKNPGCATFGIGMAGSSFVGTSPETLLELSGPQLRSDALAGTAWQSSARTLDTDKNHLEHELVVQAIVGALTGLCDDIRVPAAPERMQLESLSHWHRCITAQRPAGISAYDVLTRLHPTPAVGGTPVSAHDWLARHGEARGAWYTGGIGWIDAAGDCDISVALRCGFIESNIATLYAGAGFVAGSDPEEELIETDAKFATMLTALSDLRPRAAQCVA